MRKMFKILGTFILKALMGFAIIIEFIFIGIVMLGVPLFDMHLNYDLLGLQGSIVGIEISLLALHQSNHIHLIDYYEEYWLRLNEANKFIFTLSQSNQVNQKEFLQLCLILFPHKFTAASDMTEAYIMAKKEGYKIAMVKINLSKKLRTIQLSLIDIIFDFIILWHRKLLLQESGFIISS